MSRFEHWTGVELAEQMVDSIEEHQGKDAGEIANSWDRPSMISVLEDELGSEELEDVKETFEFCGWELELSFDDKITVTKNEIGRVYDLEKVYSVEQRNEYVLFTHQLGAYSQVKFEEGNFLVIDKFNLNDEHVESVASWVFEDHEND